MQAESSRTRSCSPPCGAPDTLRRRNTSAPTWASCATSLKRIRRGPGSSSPSPASDIDCIGRKSNEKSADASAVFLGGATGYFPLFSRGYAIHSLRIDHPNLHYLSPSTVYGRARDGERADGCAASHRSAIDGSERGARDSRRRGRPAHAWFPPDRPVGPRL